MSDKQPLALLPPTTSQSGTVAATTSTASPYLLNASDNPGALISSVVLKENNYAEWAVELRNSLQAKQKLGFINGSIPKPAADPELGLWLATNSMIVGWICTSIDPTIRSTVTFVSDASQLWESLRRRFSAGNGVRKNLLKNEIAACTQDGQPVLAYYGRLTKLWEELQNYKTGRPCRCEAAADIEKEREDDRVHKFLLGLDDRFSSIRSSITDVEPLPDLYQVYSRVVREEQNLNASRSKDLVKTDAVGLSVQTSAAPRVPLPNASRSRDRSTLPCTHCNRKGHELTECFLVQNSCEVDNIEEILERLPVKSLFRFKSVSKLWRLMIESNYLAEKRLLRHPNPKLLVLRLEISSDRCSRTIFLTTNSKDHHDDDHIKIFIHSYKSPVPYPIYSTYDIAGKIMGYCNGLVCIYDLGYIYLINPATRKLLRILSPEFLREYTDRTGWSNELPISVGFGRDMATGTYKVILMYLFDRKFVKTEALNLESGERRYVYFPISYGQLGDDKRSVFANGSLYWLPKPLSIYTSSKLLLRLAAIDLHTETFRYVSLPSWYTKYCKSVYLWSLKDSLCLSDVLQNPSVDVWSLQQEDPSVKWEKIFSVNILSTNCLDANFWKLGLAAYYFRSRGRNPASNPLDQVPDDHCSSVLYTEKLGSSV